MPYLSYNRKYVIPSEKLQKYINNAIASCQSDDTIAAINNLFISQRTHARRGQAEITDIDQFYIKSKVTIVFIAAISENNL